MVEDLNKVSREDMPGNAAELIERCQHANYQGHVSQKPRRALPPHVKSVS